MTTPVTFTGTLRRPYGVVQQLSASAVLEPTPPAPPPVALGHWRNRPSSDGGVPWRQRMDAAETQFGTFAGHWRDYMGIGSSGQLSAAHLAALAAGKRLFLNWKPRASGGTWGQVAAGSRDAVITAAARSWAPYAGGDRLWVGVEHEGDNDVGPAGSGMTAADYIAMFRRVSGIVRAEAPGVPLAWICMGFDTALAAAIWPGGSYVDLLGHDPYITAGVPPPELADRIIRRSITLRSTLAGASALPVVVAEWGPDLGGTTADRGTDQHRADAISGVRVRLAEVAAAGVRELCYFDAGSDELTGSGPDAAAYAALKAATQS